MARKLVVFGLSITSAWGNGHATTFRGLLSALHARGWEITFVEWDAPWYRSSRDLPSPPFCEVRLFDEFRPEDVADTVRAADVVLVGSYTGQATAIIDWLAGQNRPLFFYDIDTPITLTSLHNGACEYLRPDQIPLFDGYFSFTGGAALDELRTVWGARRAEALYCGVDPAIYHPVVADERYTGLLSYMGTYAPDRQPKLEALMLEPARQMPEARFVLAGAQYPPLDLSVNVAHLEHVYPGDHPAFYSGCTATLNLTRDAMVHYGWSPSVRLFEAAACGACIISDSWRGLDSLFSPGREILLAETTPEMRNHLATLTPERARSIGEAARTRVLRDHTYAHRAAQFEAAVSGGRVTEPSGVSP